MFVGVKFVVELLHLHVLWNFIDVRAACAFRAQVCKFLYKYKVVFKIKLGRRVVQSALLRALNGSEALRQ